MQLDTDDTRFLAALGIRNEPETITPHELAMLCGKLACELREERRENRRNRQAFVLTTWVASAELIALFWLGADRAGEVAAMTLAEDIASLRDKIQEVGKCFLIWFEDAGVHPEVFNDEASARKRFADLQPNWNCYLFQRIADATRTDREE